MFGMLKYDKNEWLDTVRSWGRNKGHMLAFAAGIERLLLGELSFLYANAYYYFEQKALDPNAPIGLSFFPGSNESASGNECGAGGNPPSPMPPSCLLSGP